MKMQNSTYDILKKVALRYIPALEFLWLTVGEIWHLPYTTQIGATIAAAGTFLGICLGISTKNYYKENGDGDN